MNIKLLNKLSDLTFYGFFDPSKGLVTVHFFNEENDKPDIIAYLLPNMSWDVREIIKEISWLKDDKEIVHIFHKSLGIQDSDSEFDKFVRLGLTKMAEEIHGKDINLTEIDTMFKILENNKYD